jgi:hypothetical protein
MSTPGNRSSLPSDLLEQLKAQLPESLFATVSGTFATYEKQLDKTSNQLEYAKLKIQVLEEKLRLQRIAKYGPGSEKLSSLQLELLELGPGVSNTEVATESEREALPSSSEEKKKRRKHLGGQALPTDLARVERVIGCHAGTVRMWRLRRRDEGDRLRRQRSAGCKAGRVLRASNQAREAGLPRRVKSKA